MDKDNGGKAFPLYCGPGDTENAGGMTLRAYFAAHAPAQEIEDITPQDVKGCAAYIGVAEADYKGSRDYIKVLAKARVAWADAMLAELAK